MFRLLGIHPGTDVTVSTAASLAGIPREQASLLLTELCHEHLLTEYHPGRYIFHDLLRTYAAECARYIVSKAKRSAAVRRVFDYYLHTANVATSFLCPHPIEVSRPRLQTGVVLEEIGGTRQAEAWFENEGHALLAIIDQAAEEGHIPYAWELPWVAGRYLRGEMHQKRMMTAQESAMALAVKHGDLAGQIMARQHLAWLIVQLEGTPTDRDHRCQGWLACWCPLSRLGSVGVCVPDFANRRDLAHLFRLLRLTGARSQLSISRWIPCCSPRVTCSPVRTLPPATSHGDLAR